MHAEEDLNFSLLHFAWQRLKCAPFWWNSAKLNDKKSIKTCLRFPFRLSDRAGSVGVVVCEGKETRFLTVLRTLLK